MGTVKVSRGPISPAEKRKVIDLSIEYNKLIIHNRKLMITLGISICLNIGLIIKLLINNYL